MGMAKRRFVRCCTALVTAGPLAIEHPLAQRWGWWFAAMTIVDEGARARWCAKAHPTIRGPWCVLIVCLLALSTDATAQVVLGAHTLLGQEDGTATSPAVTAPIATAASGSYLLAFSAGYTSNSNGPTDNKGNDWAPLGSPVVYLGYDGAFDVKAFVVRDAVGGAGHQVSIVKNGTQQGELTLPFIEIRNSAVLQDVAQTYAPTGTTLTSGTVTTTGPAVLVAFWWGDGGGLNHSAIPDNGFTIIENFVTLPPGSAVQCVVAVRAVAAAGTYNVHWATTPAQGAPLWLFAFQADPVLFANSFE
jgi:hypothetical protein